MNRVEELLPLLARLADAVGQPPTLADLAVQAGKSPHHLQRVFTREMGESPKQYSQRIRLQQSSAALLVTDRSIIDIAFASGFESHEGFTRAFKRRFGQSPSSFRSQHRPTFEGLTLSNRAHLGAATRSAPCVGLYRMSTTSNRPWPKTSNEGNMSMGDSSTYSVAEKRVEEVTFLHARRQTDMEGMAKTLEEVFPSMFEMCMANGLPLAGYPITRYPSFGPGLITLEAGMPLSGTVEELKEADLGGFELGTLHGGTVAFTVHTGPYERLAAAYTAIQRWMAANGEISAGAPWEVYITDPGEVPNPEEWQTEVYHPIQR